MESPTFVDVFSGCGGLALGFVMAGMRPVLAIEIDSNSADTYRLNVDRRVEKGDVADVRYIPFADVLIGGPPCQGFSALGTRDSMDPRNRLWREYVRVLDATRADVFVMENVPGLLSSPQFAMFTEAVAARGFYLAEDAILNAADFGVPQRRRRAIVIGSRLGVPELPSRSHGNGPGLEPYRTVRDAFKQSPALSADPTEMNWHRGRMRTADYSMIRYRAVPPGGNRFDMQKNLDAQGLAHLVPACWRRKQSGTVDVFGRLKWEEPSVTIRTEFFKPEKGRYLHPDADRPITVREAARLQSFPDSFRFPESQALTSVARQIGNAVPPLLAKAVAQAVIKHLIAHRKSNTAPSRAADRTTALVPA
jgi:DNA (cytosine-5)-methyltransferase 1